MAGASLGPDYDLAQRISSLEKQVASLQTRDWLANASIDQGGLDVNDGAINVKSGQAINILNGGSLNVEGGGAAYVGGLKLSALQPLAVQNWTQGFAVGTSASTVLTATITVPTGFTTAILFVNGQVEFANNNAGTVYAQGGLDMQWSSGTPTYNAPMMNIPVTGSGTNSLTCSLAGTVTGMSSSAGQTLTILGNVASGTAISANSYNAFGFNGVVLFIA